MDLAPFLGNRFPSVIETGDQTKKLTCVQRQRAHSRCMIPKGFDDIIKEDIEALVTSAVCEKRDTEYKQQLPGGTEKDTKDFLADVSSFANASGGDLIYGVRDKRDEKGQPTGIPEAADGLTEPNPVAQETRLVSMLRAGIDPRIPGLRIKHIDGFASGPVIIIRVPKSWESPHMVRLGGLDAPTRFFSRTSAGRHQLDVREIRAAFLASESLGDRISAFRSERVGKILAGETPVPLESSPKVVLHLLPVRAFSNAGVVDLKGLYGDSSNWGLRPMGQLSRYAQPRFNFNGLLYSGTSPQSSHDDSYVQLFRSGTVEAVFRWSPIESVLLGSVLEGHLIEAIPRYIDVQKQLGVGPPLFVAITIVSAKGFGLEAVAYGARILSFQRSAMDEDALLAPEMLVEESGVNIGRLLRPSLDTIWQAWGHPGSQGYDEHGDWEGYNKLLRR